MLLTSVNKLLLLNATVGPKIRSAMNALLRNFTFIIVLPKVLTQYCENPPNKICINTKWLRTVKQCYAVDGESEVAHLSTAGHLHLRSLWHDVTFFSIIMATLYNLHAKCKLWAQNIHLFLRNRFKVCTRYYIGGLILILGTIVWGSKCHAPSRETAIPDVLMVSFFCDSVVVIRRQCQVFQSVFLADS